MYTENLRIAGEQNALLIENRKLRAEIGRVRTGSTNGLDKASGSAGSAEIERLQEEVSRLHAENMKITKQQTVVRAENAKLHSEIVALESKESDSSVSKLECDIVLLKRQIEHHKEDARLQKEANQMAVDGGAWANRWGWMERSVDTKVALAMEQQLVMSALFFQYLGACRRRPPRTRVGLKVPKDASH